jgi:hypothetical protein
MFGTRVPINMHVYKWQGFKIRRCAPTGNKTLFFPKLEPLFFFLTSFLVFPTSLVEDRQESIRDPFSPLAAARWRVLYNAFPLIPMVHIYTIRGSWKEGQRQSMNGKFTFHWTCSKPNETLFITNPDISPI